MPRTPPNVNPHFFKREENGTARVRIRFTAEEANIIEEAAGDTPLVLYIKRIIMDRARAHAEHTRLERQQRLQADA